MLLFNVCFEYFCVFRGRYFHLKYPSTTVTLWSFRRILAMKPTHGHVSSMMSGCSRSSIGNRVLSNVPNILRVFGSLFRGYWPGFLSTSYGKEKLSSLLSRCLYCKKIRLALKNIFIELGVIEALQKSVRVYVVELISLVVSCSGAEILVVDNRTFHNCHSLNGSMLELQCWGPSDWPLLKDRMPVMLS
jgi:hypothetical protein